MKKLNNQQKKLYMRNLKTANKFLKSSIDRNGIIKVLSDLIHNNNDNVSVGSAIEFYKESLNNITLYIKEILRKE